MKLSEIKPIGYYEMVSELQNITTSKDFLAWLDILDNGKSINSKNITKEKLINGFCEDLAVYLVRKYNVDFVIFDDSDMHDGHYFIKTNNKFYDGFNTSGVSDIQKMEFFKRFKFKYPNIDIEKYLIFNQSPSNYYSKYYKQLDKIINH